MIVCISCQFSAMLNQKLTSYASCILWFCCIEPTIPLPPPPPPTSTTMAISVLLHTYF